MSCGLILCTWLDAWILVGCVGMLFFGIVDQDLEDRGMTWRQLGRIYRAVWVKRLQAMRILRRRK